MTPNCPRCEPLERENYDLKLELRRAYKTIERQEIHIDSYKNKYGEMWQVLDDLASECEHHMAALADKGIRVVISQVPRARKLLGAFLIDFSKTEK